MARLVAEEGLHLDVATGGELHVALRAGFPPARIVFHGNNKSRGRAAHRARVGRRPHRRRLLRRARSARGAGRRRLSRASGARPRHARGRGAHARVHRHRRRRLEVRLHRRRTAPRARPRCAWPSPTRCGFAGFHCHIGSQILRPRVVRGGGGDRRGPRRRGARATPAPRSTSSTSAAASASRTPPTTSTRRRSPTFAAVLRDAYATACATPVSTPRRALTVEAGRSIAAPAGITLYTVGTIKEIPGVRTYVAVDGGMSDNPRPATYGAAYEAFLPARSDATRPLVVHGRRQALRAGRPAGARTRTSRPTSRSATCSPPRSPARTATRWRRTTTRCRAPRSCSCATATPGSSSAARRSTTSLARDRVESEGD